MRAIASSPFLFVYCFRRVRDAAAWFNRSRTKISLRACCGSMVSKVAGIDAFDFVHLVKVAVGADDPRETVFEHHLL
jgi:hypothetical protein